MKKLVPLALLTALALAGCASGTQSADASPSATATPSASATVAPAVGSASSAEPEYAFAVGSTFGKLTRSGEPAKQVDWFFDEAGKQQGISYDSVLTYWTLRVDNRKGISDAFPAELRVYNEEGDEYIFMSTSVLVNEVFESTPVPDGDNHETPDWKAYDKLNALNVQAFNSANDVAHPGAVKEFTLVSADDLPKDLSRLTVDLGYSIGMADVITIEDAKAQGYPLDF